MTCRLAIVLLLVCAPVAAAQDRDRDGLDDAFEQALLQRFVPSFYLSAGECDAAPASFVPGTTNPMLAAKDGTIHARAFPSAAGAVELQYFHLWARDCGRNGHDLDAEHVSALVEPQPDGTWTARLWYAAAHEDTICDQSSGARAATLDAVTSGPSVFISRGKHASYLDAGQCARGCGGDACPLGRPLQVHALVNIGEPGAPLNGATWMESGRWSLGAKLRSDFDPDVRSSLDRGEVARVIALATHLRPVQAPVLAGDTALDAIAHARDAAGKALGTTASRVARGLGLMRRRQPR